MSTSKITVKEFIKRIKASGACGRGVASFMRKSGSVKQRLKKMCEVANRSRGLGVLDEHGYLYWLYYRPHLGKLVYRNDYSGLWRTHD